MRSLICWTACVSLFTAILPVPASESPREIALRVLEAQRTDDDRKLTDLTVPEPDPGNVPDDAELYAVSGYINYSCVRMFIHGDKARLQRIKMSRTWFYSPEESYAAEEWDIPRGEFSSIWEAMRLISQSSAVRKSKARSREHNGWASVRSHEPTYYVRLWSESHLWWDKACQGMSGSDKVQDFQKVQIKAMSSLLDSVLPKDGKGKPFALSRWGPFLTRLLAGSERGLQSIPDRLGDATEITIDSSLRLLGQMGYGPAKPVIEAVAADAEKSPSSASWKDAVLRETGYAMRKIAVQEEFDSAEVDRLIHGYGRRINPDRDMVQWLRDQYFEKNPDAYFSMLSHDLTAKDTSEDVTLESVEELRKRYPSAARPLLTGVLGNPSTEVSVNAALALLKSDPGNIAALETLDQAAGNPHATIPPDARWSSHFGRERALDYLTSKKNQVPPKYQWDTARIDQQLSLPWEDGRMINRLISAKVCLENKNQPDSIQIEAYRKALAKPYTMGTAEACDKLIKLRDKASAKRIAEVLGDLRDGCNKGLPWQEDADARYPWIGKADLDQSEQELKKMLP